jgi:hypothetical protein
MDPTASRASSWARSTRWGVAAILCALSVVFLATTPVWPLGFAGMGLCFVRSVATRPPTDDPSERARNHVLIVAIGGMTAVMTVLGVVMLLTR